MSGWSAVGLADRNTVENLIKQIESLRNENRELLAENQRLVSAQISEKYSGLYTAENQSTQFLTARLMEMHKDLSAKMEGMSRLIYQQLITHGEKTDSNILLAEKKINANISVLQASVNTFSEIQEKIQPEVKSALSTAMIQVEERGAHLEQVITTEGDSLRKSIVQLNTQMSNGISLVVQNQRELFGKSCETITESNKDLISRVEQHCTSALEAIKNIAERYKQMEYDEQESLEKIRTLSSEMLDLGEHQKRVMEHLSQLCQDSDQFMEIQKSINDIWEIMKAVWVDSLLNDFNNKLNGEISVSGAEVNLVEEG